MTWEFLDPEPVVAISGILCRFDYLKSLDREMGKFRTFLLVVLKRFLANEWDKANRLKRGGDRQIISFDAVDTEQR